MDQQNQNEPKRAYTAEEIVRLEAEAVAAIQRGEAIPRQTPEAQPDDAKADSTPEFVPYVDDVPEPEPVEGDATDDDDDDAPYVPSAMEKRLDALTPDQWKRWQIIGGVGVGLASVACLFMFGDELSTYGLVVAVLLAVLLPRYLERDRKSVV